MPPDRYRSIVIRSIVIQISIDHLHFHFKEINFICPHLHLSKSLSTAYFSVGIKVPAVFEEEFERENGLSV